MASRLGQPHRGLENLCVFAVFAAFFLLLCDLNGYEGDDLNSILPMIHLPELLDGQISGYRYAWQPLSYWTGYLVASGTGSISAVFCLAGLAMAAGLTLLHDTMRHHLGTSLLLTPILCLLLPELLYSGLYYNSTALGFPFAACAVWLAFARPDASGALLTGFCLGIAVLMRMDYVLIAPAIAVFRLWHRRSALDFALVTIAGFIALGLGLLLVDPRDILETYQLASHEISERAHEPGWDDSRKIQVALTVFSPVGWLTMGAAGLWLATHKRYWLASLLGLLCLLPLVYSARHILTPKYMLPLFSILPVGLAIIWTDVKERSPIWLSRTVALMTTVSALFFVALGPDFSAPGPLPRLTMQRVKTISTHDGHRPLGAYGRQWYGMRSEQTERDRQAEALFQALHAADAPKHVTFVGEANYFADGGLAWRNLQLLLERAGYRGEVIGTEQISFSIDGQTVVLSERRTNAGCEIVLKETEDPVKALAEFCSPAHS